MDHFLRGNCVVTSIGRKAAMLCHLHNMNSFHALKRAQKAFYKSLDREVSDYTLYLMTTLEVMYAEDYTASAEHRMMMLLLAIEITNDHIDEAMASAL